MDTYLDRVVMEMRKWPPPKNGSTGTKRELDLLVEYSNSDKGDDFRDIYDKQLIPHLQQIFIEAGANAEEVKVVSENVVTDIYPVITKLKYYFQRPRPFQLACYYKLNLFPKYSHYVSSPSYPSGHTTMAAVVCEVLGNRFPEMYGLVKGLVTDISESRLYMGVHYPSDNDRALMLMREIISHPVFRAKYEL
ncbi:MAG TPA: phosphatase PAP2 family protein [Anaerovoracaceae bacterium]|nr:phosphatase PAP2 family protein [Anaerovoracaceae bacterium]